MEGNEPNKYEDDELNPDSGKKEESDSDSFGLPDFEAAASESYEDSKKKEGDSYSFDESYSSDSWGDEKKDDDIAHQPDPAEEIDYGYNQPAEELNVGISEGYEDSGIKEEPYKSTYYEEDYKRTRSPIGWILLFIFVLIAVIVAIFWWLNRDEEPVVVKRQEPVITQPQIIETPPVEENKEDAAANEAKNLAYKPGSEGQVIEISEATNRYYVIVASAIDDDLLMDYAKKLAKQGKKPVILAPRGKTKFYRLAIADFQSLNDAALRAEELKADFGQDVWVKRY